MNQLTEGRKPQTKRARFTSLLAFFNFAKNNLDPDFINPCDSPMLRKLFRTKVKTQFDILEKETVDCMRSRGIPDCKISTVTF